MADVFISYRRDGGEVLAQLINDNLVDKNYSVFYDIESLSSERFDDRLLKEIEMCTDFILVLPRGGLDRCLDNENDWVRKEIRHALEHKKHIVPVLMRGFEFPENMPKDIDVIKNLNGVRFLTMDLFDAKMEQLCSFLDADPRSIGSAVGNIFKKFSALFRVILSPVSLLGGMIWRFYVTRYAALLLAAFLVLSIGTDVSRGIAETSKGRKIEATALFSENSKGTSNITVSETNNEFVTFDGTYVTLHTVSSNGKIDDVAKWHTSIDTTNVGIKYIPNTREIWVVGKNKAEFIPTQGGEKRIVQFDLPAVCESNAETWIITGLMHLEDYYVIEWWNIESDQIIISICSLSGRELENEYGTAKNSGVLEDCAVLGNSIDDRYFIVFDKNPDKIENIGDEILVYDAKEGVFIEEVASFLRDKRGEIYGEYFEHPDENQRYFCTAFVVESEAVSDEDRYGVKIWDMETGACVCTKYYCQPHSIEFGENNNILVAYETSSSIELVSVDINTQEQKTLLSGEDLLDLTNQKIYNSFVRSCSTVCENKVFAFFYMDCAYFIDLQSKSNIGYCEIDTNQGIGDYGDIFQNGDYIYISSIEKDAVAKTYRFPITDENGRFFAEGQMIRFYTEKEFVAQVIGLAVIVLLLALGYKRCKNIKSSKKPVDNTPSEQAE